MSRREEDVASELFIANSHDFVLFFSDRGRVYRLKCYEIPEGSRTSRGMNITNLLPLEPEERITSMLRVTKSEEEDHFLTMVTKNAVIKRVALSAFRNVRKNGLIALDLAEDDELSWVRLTSGSDDLLVATRFGKAASRTPKITACSIAAAWVSSTTTLKNTAMSRPLRSLISMTTSFSSQMTV